jgi:predicted amidophosphoribosyltransferase
MERELAIYPDLYPDLSEMIYAPRWYYSLSIKKDDYSHHLAYHSKRQDTSNYFYDSLKSVIDELIALGKLNDLNLITIVPSSKIGVYSPTLVSLAEKTAQYLQVPFERIIERIKETGRKNVKGNSAQERHDLVKESMKISREPAEFEKNVLLLDDVKVTGMSLLESKKILLAAGVKSTVSVCLGINAAIDWDKLLVSLKGEKYE